MDIENKSSAALVIGAGIAGIKTSLELAESGIKVYLCESQNSSGGALLTMERWFPDDACGMCKSLPFFTDCAPSDFCLRRGFEHPNITFLASSLVRGINGEPGNFTVSIEKKASVVDAGKCIACGLCAEICPVTVERRPGDLWGMEKAIGLVNAQALRKTYAVDDEHCTKCFDCVKKCPTGAIDFKRETEAASVHVGVVIVSSGFESLNPEKLTEYGYGRYPNVVTSFELEHILTGYGSSDGKLIRPSDKKTPKSIAFIQCVGSRITENNYCSSVCCMFAIKEAGMILKTNPETDVKIFYMDIRAHARHCEQYYNKSASNGVSFVRSRIAAIRQNFANNNLIITSMTNTGETVDETFDMVVLSSAKKPSDDFAQLAETLGIAVNEWGFAETSKLDVSKSSRDGIFLCGSVSGPKDIAESISEAGAAAAKTAGFLSANRYSIEAAPIISPYNENIAVVICNCKKLLLPKLDTAELAAAAKKMPDVKTVLETEFLCETPDSLQDILKESGASRLVVAACSIYRRFVRVGDIPVSFVNIREGAAWLYDRSGALEAAENGLRLAVLDCRYKTGGHGGDSVNSLSALVVGGGVAGMEAALVCADRGIEVDLVEKTESLGGAVREISYMINGADAEAYLSETISKVEKNPLIKVRTRSELLSLKGFAGDFSYVIKGAEGETELDCGAVILATGAADYEPAEYSYGSSPLIVTQRELERKLAAGLSPAEGGAVVMIQCVGSRNSVHEYCSRLCCLSAVKNAIKIKELYPDVPVSVIYRDMRTYGFNELYYEKARELGVIFHAREDDKDPEVKINNEQAIVRFRDCALNEDIELNANLIVLSVSLVPGLDVPKLADITGIKIAADGFFREAEEKFRPYDSSREGVFLCGTAAGPKGVAETISQARAAANHAVSILSREVLQTGRAAAKVLPRRCTGCEQCVPYCEYSARVKDIETRTVIVRESLCQGCGACSSVCPNNAASQREFTAEHVFAMIDTLV